MNAQPVAPEFPAINKRNHAMTRFLLSRLERNLDVQIRLHGLRDQFAFGGGIVVANHFTRLETFVIPFVLYRELGLVVRILAAPMFFTNKVFGKYLMSIGALPANYPNKYELIARDILHGGWWLIFPEGSMIKDRKVVERGRLLVNTETGTIKRRPHSGAGIIALTVQRYRDALQQAPKDSTEREAICRTLALSDVSPSELEAIASAPTSIVPLNVTYYPLNPQDNLIKTLATRLAPKLLQSDMGERILEELTVEGSMLLKGVEIDLRLGTPLLMEAGMPPSDAWQVAPWSASPWRRCLEVLRAWQPIRQYAYLLDRCAAFHGRQQRRRAWQYTQAYMRAIYSLSTVNMDHLLSGLLFLMWRRYRRERFPETELKQRVYFAVRALRDLRTVYLHPDLADRELQYRLLTPQPHAGIEHFVQRAEANTLLSCVDHTWVLAIERLTDQWPFGAVRLQNFMQVCYNEIEPLTEVMQALRHAVRIDLSRLQASLADDLLAYEQQLYEEEYTAFAAVDSAKILPMPRGPGTPILLRSDTAPGAVGVLLIHGYSASPAEVLPLAHYLHAYGMTVYVVRLRGHGTSPYDLQQQSWQAWYDSVLRGYYALRALSDVQFAGGMSMGGALALYLAAQQVESLQGVFAVGAPIKLHNRYLRLIPVAKAMRDFVRAEPENPRTNYTYQPLRAVWQLTQFIDVYQEALSRVTLPVLLVQARGDTTVRPESAQLIYERLSSQDKRLLWKDIDRHVIVGDDYPDVHHDILTFLQHHSSLTASTR
jgi:esterase/lipase/1-acyl-sn-glycerol-3-phosphate acyltransferase